MTFTRLHRRVAVRAGRRGGQRRQPDRRDRQCCPARQPERPVRAAPGLRPASAGRSGCWPRWASPTSSTAVALAQPALGRRGRTAARAGFLATFGSLYLTWNAATLAGALGAGRLGSPGSFGLDVVGPAAFLALLWPRLRDGRTERAVALAGAVIALAATPFCPPGLPVVLAAAAALGAALLLPASAARSPAGL